MKDQQALSQLFHFTENHWQEDITKLAFKKELVKGWQNQLVLQQLYGKQKAKNKLPFLFNQSNILYPPKVSLEQCTSQQVATWKAQLVNEKTLLDMTGGFGIDSYFFAQQVEQITYLEQQIPLNSIVQHNFKALGVANIRVVSGDAIDFLNQTSQQFDWIYLDPARRDGFGNRKFDLADYMPNVLLIKELLFQKGRKILLKTSPMLDIQQALSQLEKVVHVYVVALKNEVKELLFEMNTEVEKEPTPTLHCINLSATTVAYKSQYCQVEVTYSLPKTYLYEPNAAILKAGLFKEITTDFKVEKLHSNTHLYTSSELVKDFPGRIFLIKAVLPYQKKVICPYLESAKANIATRNFPNSVEQMKKKLGLKDGGAHYLFGVTLMDNSLRVLVCEKIDR